MSKRLLWVDVVRSLAIVLMVIFHFCYDLRYFGYVNWSVPNGSGWWQFRYLILTLFIFTVGVSLFLAHQNKINKPAFYKRLLQIVLSSLAITIMSLFMFPKTWIYFGILHFIAFASILGIVLVPYPKIALLVGAIIVVSFWLGITKSSLPFEFFEQWLPDHTEDFVPIFPWLGVMCLGLGFMSMLPNKGLDFPKNKVTSKMAFIGRHGLLIYLLHQPLFFAGFFLVQALGK